MPYNPALRPKSTQDDSRNTYGNACAVITPGATDQIASNGLYYKYFVMANTGDVTFVPYGNADANTVTLTGLPSGTMIPGRIRRILSATAPIHGWID